MVAFGASLFECELTVHDWQKYQWAERDGLGGGSVTGSLAASFISRCVIGKDSDVACQRSISAPRGAQRRSSNRGSICSINSGEYFTYHFNLWAVFYEKLVSNVFYRVEVKKAKFEPE